MRPGGGKHKGNSFESQVAKKLSAGLAPLNFKRSEGSGARVGGKNYETIGKMFGADALKLFVGDIMVLNEKEAGVNFKHSIECKAYKTPDNFTGLVSGAANIFGWMKEAEDDAVKIGRNGLLIFKWNQTPIFVATASGTTLTGLEARLSIIKDRKGIDIFYLTDLLQIPAFWYDTTNKE